MARKRATKATCQSPQAEFYLCRVELLTAFSLLDIFFQASPATLLCWAVSETPLKTLELNARSSRTACMKRKKALMGLAGALGSFCNIQTRVGALHVSRGKEGFERDERAD